VLSWQVGRVKITRIVEMDLPVPAMVIPQATAAELRKSVWLYPHFVGEDDTLKLSIHALPVEAPGLKLVVDTCIGNDRPRRLVARRQRPEGRRAHPLAPLRRMGRPDDPRHRHPLPRPHRRPNRPRRRASR